MTTRNRVDINHLDLTGHALLFEKRVHNEKRITRDKAVGPRIRLLHRPNRRPKSRHQKDDSRGNPCCGQLRRALLDEVFGADNFVAAITFKKTAGQTSQYMPGTCDYLVWYANKIEKLKYRT